MGKLWLRFQRWIRRNEQRDDCLAVNLHSKPQTLDLNPHLWEHESLSSQRALAPSTLVAGSHDSPLTTGVQESWGPPNTPTSCPERHVTRTRMWKLDRIVPKELHSSKVPCDNQDLTQSGQAGQLPYCEDIADRNLLKSKVSLRAKASSNRTPLPHQPRERPNYTRKAGKPPCSYPAKALRFERKDTGSEVERAIESRNPLYPNKLGRVDIPERRSRSMHVQTPNPNQYQLLREERRHSLTHKPDILDLRKTSEIDHLPVQVQPNHKQRSGSETSRRSSLTRSRLDAPLPTLPIPQYERSVEQITDDQQHDPDGHHLSSRGNEQASHSFPTNDFSSTTDTTIYERWAPAVTHETITRNVHEIREEHIHREIHHYHIKHLIQPVIDYEILPARHFVQDKDHLREIGEEEIPQGAPCPEWYAMEVASKLGSLPIDEVPWEESPKQGPNIASQGHPETSNSLDGASETLCRNAISMATSAALLRSVPSPVGDRGAVRVEYNDRTPTPAMRKKSPHTGATVVDLA